MRNATTRTFTIVWTVLLIGCSSHTPATTIAPDQVAALEAIVERGQSAVPTDTDTSRVAAQLSELEHDRAAALAAANMLQLSVNDPAYADTAAQLDLYRQDQLKQAADDATKMAAILAATDVPGKTFLATDGAPSLVLKSIVAQSFAAKAKVFLDAGIDAKAHGGAGPSSSDIADFLQEEVIVASDDGEAGHGVASGTVARALLDGASVESIIAAGGVGP